MKATFSKSAPSSFSRGMQMIASSRNLILVSSCSLRRSLFCFFFQPLLQEQSRLFSSREFLFFLDNPKIIQMLSILGETLRWRKRNKTVTKTTHKYRQNHWGVELKPQLHMRRRVLPLHLRRVTESPPSPRKFSMNTQANTDFRSYQYAGLPCNAAPQFKAPWEGLMFKFLTKSQIIFSCSQLLARF